MTITIIGAGAIGGVLGAHIARAGHRVVFCDIVQEHVDKINDVGIQIEGPDETFLVKAEAYTPEQMIRRGEPLETVFLCVKAQFTEEAITQVLPLITEDTQVVSFQNGFCEDIIASIIGKKRTIGCFVNFSADYLEPGRILYGGISTVVIGELDGEITERVCEVQKLLDCWGPVQVSDNVWGYLWGKLSYAALLFATALVDTTMADVVGKWEYREVLMELCSEILEVAHKQNIIPMGFDDWEPSLVYPRETRNKDVLNEQLKQLEVRMATNKKTRSGIWRDLVVRKRKTEVDYQLTPVVELGRGHGLDLPLTSFVVKAIKEIENGERNMSWENLDEMKNLYSNIHS